MDYIRIKWKGSIQSSEETDLRKGCSSLATNLQVFELIHKLIRQGHLKQAFEVLGLMKNNGCPPFIGPCITHISKSGIVDDALGLLNATSSSKGLPSRRVFVLVSGFIEIREA